MSEDFGKETRRPWRARPRQWTVDPRETVDIQAELPCINGLPAWFTLFSLVAPEPAEVEMSDGAIGDHEANAALIVAAVNGYDENTARIRELEGLLREFQDYARMTDAAVDFGPERSNLFSRTDAALERASA